MTEDDHHQLNAPLGSVKAIGPLIRAYDEETEHNRRLSQPVVAALKEAGLFRMYIPRTLGGFEVPPQVLYFHRPLKPATLAAWVGLRFLRRFCTAWWRRWLALTDLPAGVLSLALSEPHLAPFFLTPQ